MPREEALIPPPAENDEAARPLSARQCLENGDAMFFRGDHKSALRWYTRAMDKDTVAIDPWIAMLRLLLLKGDLGEAGIWIHRGLTLFPDDPRLLSMRAVLTARRGMLREALTQTDAVLERNSGIATAQLARGEVLLIAGSRSADDCFRQGLRLLPADDWRSPFLIGLVHEERRQWARALEYFLLACERDSRSPATWMAIARTRAQLGQRWPALQAAERVQELCAAGDVLNVQAEHLRAGSFWRRLSGWLRI